ncbi:MAG TPA: GntR family transcriptional regulator [Lysobacter sp.]|jgi:DNA-binding GntR family transcriptional regulator|nr:GntR family transcriptional regulator [Lysobacter sp.]
MSAPKAADLARDLAQGIARGRFPVGSLLPTEFELCDQYGASRYTVRLALAELQEQGLISRKKNVGSKVEASRATTGFVQSLSSVEDLVLFGATNFRAIHSIEEVVVDLALAKELGCVGGSRWLRVSSLRFDSKNRKRPVAWLDIYIDPAYADVAETARQYPNVLISSLIEARYGRRIARIQQIIDATAVPKTMAEALKAEPGSPALKIVRRYLDAANEAFELSVSVHPAGRLTVSTDLKRSRE